MCRESNRSEKRGRKNNSSNFVYIQVSSLSILTIFFTENSKEGKLSKKEKAATIEDVLCKQVTTIFYIKTTIMQFYDEFMLFVIFSILILFCSYLKYIVTRARIQFAFIHQGRYWLPPISAQR